MPFSQPALQFVQTAHAPQVQVGVLKAQGGCSLQCLTFLAHHAVHCGLIETSGEGDGASQNSERFRSGQTQRAPNTRIEDLGGLRILGNIDRAPEEGAQFFGPGQGQRSASSLSAQFQGEVHYGPD